MDICKGQKYKYCAAYQANYLFQLVNNYLVGKLNGDAVFLKLDAAAFCVHFEARAAVTLEVVAVQVTFVKIDELIFIYLKTR